ncbi:hypothetical protein NCU16501 [Neurospora crassa OR74A]|uniref:Uncharacterized protein n=1 Tax=Neurospora crassa (strain ATCC 24698 / 74-OR23-1A / CBS 708.71 / DSM 1257 / FGSC 987) TaxID=367110 RepID=V5IP59_NEUCR|nr:hypothetical protein NCU16501 [Neurospora crassa OR74A]ESA43485.1 hypothetical protein NCU16501 [Neurospora crassa OR74A]|eukprot:XP_011393665.1 hypothetical protein NCU16501 [Neurospora crassa OR74A]
MRDTNMLVGRNRLKNTRGGLFTKPPPQIPPPPPKLHWGRSDCDDPLSTSLLLGHQICAGDREHDCKWKYHETVRYLGIFPVRFSILFPFLRRCFLHPGGEINSYYYITDPNRHIHLSSEPTIKLMEFLSTSFMRWTLTSARPNVTYKISEISKDTYGQHDQFELMLAIPISRLTTTYLRPSDFPVTSTHIGPAWCS